MTNEKTEYLINKYILSSAATELLAKIIIEKIDLKDLVTKELEARGFDKNGQYIGLKAKADKRPVAKNKSRLTSSLNKRRKAK